METGEEDDPVVQEIDVYLAKSLSENLFLIQYPVRPAGLTYEGIPKLSTRFKPKQKKIEMELSMNTRSPHYAKGKGEQIAINVDKPGSSDKPYFSTNKMDKQVLTSAVALKKPNTYAVALYKDRELHLTPVQTILQMRPSFSYLDRSDKGRPESGAGDAEQEEEGQDDAKPVMVTFARRETEEAKARRLASYEHKQKLEREEPWVHCEHHEPTDPIADGERELLQCRIAGDTSEFQMPAEDYLEKLLPQLSAEEKEKVAMPSNVVSLADLKLLPLGDQVKALLTNAKLMRFSQLMGLLPKDTDQTAVLRAVQQVAILVQGCWVVKSDVLYPKDSCSAHSGIPAEVLCRARDYVLWKFTQTDCISRKEITNVIKIPSEDLKDILSQLSRYHVNKGWQYALSYDDEFVNRYPEVVQRQQMIWDAKSTQLIKVLNLSNPDKKKKDPTAGAIEKPKRRRTTSRSRHKSGERSMSDQSDAEMDTSMKSPTTIRSPDINHVITNCANGPHTDMLTNGTKSETDLKCELLKFVREKLTTRHILSLSELKRLYTLQLAQCPPGHILSTGVTDKLLESCVIEAGGITLNNQWPPGVQAEPLYAYVQMGDSLDQVRAGVLAAFAGHMRLRSQNIKKSLDDKGIKVSDPDLKKLLKDYCVSRGATWYLKFAVPNDGPS